MNKKPPFVNFVSIIVNSFPLWQPSPILPYVLIPFTSWAVWVLSFVRRPFRQNSWESLCLSIWIVVQKPTCVVSESFSFEKPTWILISVRTGNRDRSVTLLTRLVLRRRLKVPPSIPSVSGNPKVGLKSFTPFSLQGSSFRFVTFFPLIRDPTVYTYLLTFLFILFPSDVRRW